MSRSDIAETLSAVRLFRGAEPGFFARVAQQPRARLARKAGELVYEPGDPADAIFVAVARDSEGAGPQGIVELSLPTADAGSQSHVEHIVSGDVFGEFEFVASGLSGARAVRRSGARVVVDVDLYRISFDLLAPLLTQAETVRARLIKLSFDRLMSALNVKSTQLLGDRDVAFANWLTKAAGDIGIAEGRHVRFSRPIGQREIADALGVARETMSLRLNEWERAGLINTGGQSQRLEILDFPRVQLRAGVDEAAPQSSIDAGLLEVDADLSKGDLVRARNIGLDLLMFFPSSPELRHRVALANIRAGNTREALAGLAYGGFATGGDIAVLRERVRRGLLRPSTAPDRLFFGNGAAGDDAMDDDLDDAPDLKRRMPTLVEDLAAIEARAQKELAFGADDDETRRDHARASADYYDSIYAALGGTYAGINAAMMAAIAGEAARSAKTARAVVRQLGTRPAGYWPNATLAEAHLLLGDEAAAEERFAAANREADASDGHRSSTRLQVRRIADHLAVAADRHLAALPVGATAVYSGPLFRGSRFDDAAQRQLEDALRAPLAEAIAAEGVRYVYGALACGADIVTAETALDAGAELHIVLPFPADMFAETSVVIGNPPDAPDRWNSRFWQCLRRSASLITLVERPPDLRHLDPYYFHAFKLAAGLALLRADTLSARAVMLAMDDQRTDPASVAGARTAARDWAAAGLPVVPIPLAVDASTSSSTPPPQRDPFRPAVFLWSMGEPFDLPATVAKANAGLGLRLDPIPRTSRDRRQGLAVPVETIADALKLSQALTGIIGARHPPVRIIADFGPATDAKGAPNETAISRLSAASDLVGLPASTAIATLVFAARARAEPDIGVRFTPIGRTAAVGGEKAHDADGRPLPSREVYTIAFPLPARAAARRR